MLSWLLDMARKLLTVDMQKETVSITRVRNAAKHGFVAKFLQFQPEVQQKYLVYYEEMDKKL
jgi:hypothetical protein